MTEKGESTWGLNALSLFRLLCAVSPSAPLRSQPSGLAAIVSPPSKLRGGSGCWEASEGFCSHLIPCAFPDEAALLLNRLHCISSPPGEYGRGLGGSDSGAVVWQTHQSRSDADGQTERQPLPPSSFKQATKGVCLCRMLSVMCVFLFNPGPLCC